MHGEDGLSYSERASDFYASGPLIQLGLKLGSDFFALKREIGHLSGSLTAVFEIHSFILEKVERQPSRLWKLTTNFLPLLAGRQAHVPFTNTF